MVKKGLRVVLCMLMVLCLSGCMAVAPSALADRWELSDGESYFYHYISKTRNGVCRVKGSVYLHVTDAGLVHFTAKKDAELVVRGDIEGVDGDVQLVYEAPDGAETVIVDGDGQELDELLSVQEGEGEIYFTGEGECDFNLKIRAGEDVLFGGQEEADSVKDASFPGLTDDWPESIVLEDKGMTADPLCIDFQVEEPMKVSVSCITTGGELELKIINGEETEVYFEEEDPRGEHEVMIDEPGDCYLVIYARDHQGRIEMTPVD